MLYSIIQGGVSNYKFKTITVANKDNHISVFYTYIKQFRKKSFFNTDHYSETYVKLVP